MFGTLKNPKGHLACLSRLVFDKLGDDDVGRSEWNSHLLQSLPVNLLNHRSRALSSVDDALK